MADEFDLTEKTLATERKYTGKIIGAAIEIHKTLGPGLKVKDWSITEMRPHGYNEINMG